MTKMAKRTTDIVVAVALPSIKAIHAVYIKKALAKSLVIFFPKRPGLFFQDWFLSLVD
jgi:hypothetical protein